jgi:hypothetical protein
MVLEITYKYWRIRVCFGGAEGSGSGIGDGKEAAGFLGDNGAGFLIIWGAGFLGVVDTWILFGGGIGEGGFRLACARLCALCISLFWPKKVSMRLFSWLVIRLVCACVRAIEKN